jgi:hypothetical protein
MRNWASNRGWRNLTPTQHRRLQPQREMRQRRPRRTHDLWCCPVATLALVQRRRLCFSAKLPLTQRTLCSTAWQRHNAPTVPLQGLLVWPCCDLPCQGKRVASPGKRVARTRSQRGGGASVGDPPRQSCNLLKSTKLQPSLQPFCTVFLHTVIVPRTTRGVALLAATCSVLNSTPFEHVFLLNSGLPQSCRE